MKPTLKPLLEQRLKQLLPDENDFQEFNKIIHISPPNWIRCNTLKIQPAELFTRLSQKWQIKQPFPTNPEIFLVEGSNATAYCKGGLSQGKTSISQELKFPGSFASRGLGALAPGELGRAEEHMLGYYYIQDLASMLPPIVLNPQKQELILDMCAAPGSKTTQLASMMQNQGTIIANELKMPRLKVLSANLEKAGIANTIITKKDAIAFCSRISKETNIRFDKILLDAPCSGEGTLRSSPKTFFMWNPKMIRKFSNVQKKLLATSLSVLKKGGTLVYSTCTHAPEEDEEVIDFALKNFPVKIEPITLPISSRQGITSWEDKTFSKELKHACRIYPHDNNTEGFFLAKLTLLEKVKAR